MPKQSVIFRNPLRLLGGDASTILPSGGFGAISARAGVGKTALLVQIALERMLHDQDVLHVSLGDPLDKVKLWYKQVLTGLASTYEKDLVKDMWDDAAHHRMIMTFNVEDFSVPRFEERLTDLTEQLIISPQVVLVDGLDFDKEGTINTLHQLKEVAQKYGLRFWFAVRSHRNSQSSGEGVPANLMEVSDLFDTMIDLQPKDGDIFVHLLKSAVEVENPNELVLDTRTMLVKDKD